MTLMGTSRVPQHRLGEGLGMGTVLQACFLALAVLLPVLTPASELLSRFPRCAGGEQLGSYQGLEMVCRMCWCVCVCVWRGNTQLPPLP